MNLKFRAAFLVSIAVLASAAAPLSKADELLASAWFEGFNNKARLHAGKSTSGPSDQVYLGLEIVMPEGWKTYWRSPGDAGGVPPEIDWSKSVNLASARVLFPAPKRYVDKAGNTIGYKDRVLFPIEFTPKDANAPVVISLTATYGVCKDICIPAESTLELEVPPGASPSPEISDAYMRVPRSVPLENDPVLKSWKVEKNGGKARLVLEVRDPAPGATDAFVETSDAMFIPVPVRVSDQAGLAVFEVDLSDLGGGAALRDKPLTVTVVGAKGQSQSTIHIE